MEIYISKCRPESINIWVWYMVLVYPGHSESQPYRNMKQTSQKLTLKWF